MLWFGASFCKAQIWEGHGLLAAYCINPGSDAKKRYEYSDESGKKSTYSSIKKDENGNYVCETDVNYSSKYLDVSGKVDYILQSMPRKESQFEYAVKTASVKENINVNWKLDGEYSAQFEYRKGFILKLEKSDLYTISWKLFDDSGEVELEPLSWFKHYKTLNYEIDIGDYKLKITPNSMYVKHGSNYTGFADEDSEYRELIKNN